jgi:DNA-binding MarR family transcriptional regulator
MANKIKDLTRVITGVRRCFWLLGTASDEMVADLGVTASLRAVLEHLTEFGAQTVPQIAREKAVKRQSIQVLVDQLRHLGLVSVQDNPAHRRSVLIALTKQGKAIFGEIQAREIRALAELGKTLDGRALATTAETLTSLRDALKTLIHGEDDDDN